MIAQPLLWSLCAIIALSACSTSLVDNDTSFFATADKSPSLEKKQMQVYIASAESKLLLLEQQQSQRCISGQLAIAQRYLTLAVAEHNAGMEKDAFITLIELDRQVRKIQCINQYITGQLGCGYTHKKSVLKRWYHQGEFEQCKTPVNATETVKKSHVLMTETLFDFNQDRIKAIYYQSLNKLIELMKNYPESSLLISGHTDSLGSSTFNVQLSKQRAANVAKYFIDKGIAASKIAIEYEGESKLREVELNDVARVFNRYTAITIFLDIQDKK